MYCIYSYDRKYGLESRLRNDLLSFGFIVFFDCIFIKKNVGNKLLESHHFHVYFTQACFDHEQDTRLLTVKYHESIISLLYT